MGGAGGPAREGFTSSALSALTSGLNWEQEEEKQAADKGGGTWSCPSSGQCQVGEDLGPGPEGIKGLLEGKRVYTRRTMEGKVERVFSDCQIWIQHSGDLFISRQLRTEGPGYRAATPSADPEQQKCALCTLVQTHRGQGPWKRKLPGSTGQKPSQGISYNLRMKVIKAKSWLIASPRTTALHFSFLLFFLIPIDFNSLSCSDVLPLVALLVSLKPA